MKNTNHSELLRVLAGEGGDYFIGTTAVTTKKFSKIKVTAAATLTDVKVRGVSVKTARNYPNSVPVGYEMIAGGDDYFDYIELSAGSAEGYVYPEEPVIGGLAVVVDGGVAGAAMTIEVAFNNTGNAASRKLYWRVRNDADEIVQSGENTAYFLSGSTLTVDVTGNLYFATADTGYELDIQLEGSELWTTSAPFEITEAE